MKPKFIPLGHQIAYRSHLGNWFRWTAHTIIVLQGIVWITRYAPDVPSETSRVFLVISSLLKTHQSNACRPTLPQLVDAVHPSDTLFRQPSHSLDIYLKKRTSKDDIDSLAIAVITPSGAVFQKGYGILKANATEPEQRGTVDENSIYRIASITKMFNALETFILREKAVLNWDDPLTKFLPNFTYNPYGWSKHLSGNTTISNLAPEPITLRQLASHMSGIGRDYPPADLGKWPPDPSGHFIPTENSPAARIFMTEGNRAPTKAEILDAIKEYPLVAPPYSYPIYSNTGFNLLGWANVAANAAAGNLSKEPQEFADLVRRDIFEPLGMKSSAFTVSCETASRLAVAMQDNWEADLDFTDSMNPCGGQYSSLSDLSIFMQTLLDPKKANSVISPYTVREWLRPLHGRQRFYAKGGNLASYHSHFSVNPSSSYGVIVLVTGQYSNTAQLAYEAIRRFQPVFDQIQQRAANENFGGRWVSGEGESNEAIIQSHKGSLWISKLVLHGIDLLALVQERKPGQGKPLALWSSGAERINEFRIAIGRPAINNQPLMGCEPYWVSIDSQRARGAPVDLLYFEREAGGGPQVLKIPSAGVTLRRKLRGG